MKRNVFDETREAAGHADTEPRGACCSCGMSTLAATLRQYGARCFGCYEAYCAQGIAGMNPPPLAFKTSTHGPKAWAMNLRHREQQGERLSKLQREAWRKALHLEPGAPA